MPRLLIAFLFTFVFASSAFTQHSKKPIDKLHLPWIHFNWQGDSLAHRYVDKAAITIPIKIGHLPYNFNMQFDLGAQTTMFYEKPLRA